MSRGGVGQSRLRMSVARRKWWAALGENALFGLIFTIGAFFLFNLGVDHDAPRGEDGVLNYIASLGVDASDGVLELFGASIAVLLGCLLAVIGGSFRASTHFEESDQRTLVLLLSNTAFAVTVPAFIAVLVATAKGCVPTGDLLTVVPAFIIVAAMAVSVGSFDVASRKVKRIVAREVLTAAEGRLRVFASAPRGGVLGDAVVLGVILSSLVYIVLLITLIFLPGSTEVSRTKVIFAALASTCVNVVSMRLAIEVAAIRILGRRGRSGADNLSSLYVLFVFLLLHVMSAIIADGGVALVLLGGAIASLVIFVVACTYRGGAELDKNEEKGKGWSAGKVGMRGVSLKRSARIAEADVNRARRVYSSFDK